ncbi:hypothetical protein K443DRAFT_347279 [Laccaria amethystina LaAM-08-1]|jgi:hypothetical protein|uniref:Uncharacterized protein n=1 Tax=Laccaria amethystina LaAM-08-1 TaxID=1095629 RepID=A0A0C9WJL5_9AGAR|nr:hypothetical protein K443DRAFT_347279 [Laccaria amethystina LaAM-08-1]
MLSSFHHFLAHRALFQLSAIYLDVHAVQRIATSILFQYERIITVPMAKRFTVATPFGYSYILWYILGPPINVQQISRRGNNVHGACIFSG